MAAKHSSYSLLPRHAKLLPRSTLVRPAALLGVQPLPRLARKDPPGRVMLALLAAVLGTAGLAGSSTPRPTAEGEHWGEPVAEPATTDSLLGFLPHAARMRLPAGRQHSRSLEEGCNTGGGTCHEYVFLDKSLE